MMTPQKGNIGIQLATIFCYVQLQQEYIMQGYQGVLKRKTEFNQLITKIGRLRRKLISYGWSLEEIMRIILFQFLKLPKIDWKELKTTTLYYEVKDKYKLDAGTAQLVLCLQQIVPNLHTSDVCQYLLNVLLYNSLEFGFNLDDSSSDSNESSSYLHQKLKYRPKLRLKKKKSQKRLNKQGNCERQKKKVKKTQENQEKQAYKEEREFKQTENQRQQRFFTIIQMKQPAFRSFSPSDDEIEKKMKREESDCE